MNLSSAVFYTRNITSVKEFYKNLLGLRLDYETQNFISFIFENNIKLGIKLAKETREIPGAQAIFVSINSIDTLFEKLKDKCKIYKTPTKEVWAYEFAILDPDGNKITFTET